MADDPNAPEQLSPSKLAAENAYRKRKGLPPIDAFGNEVAGGSAAAAPPASAPAVPSTPAAAAPPAAAAVPPAAAAAFDLGPPPPGVEPMNSSKLASENAYRKRKGQPLIDAYGRELPPGAAPAAAATPAAPAATTAAPAATAAAPPAAAAFDLGPPPPGVEPMNSSKLASENAYRKRKGQPLIDAYGRELPPGAAPPAAAKPAAPAAAAATPSQQTAATTAAPPRAAVAPIPTSAAQMTPAAAGTTRGSDAATKYVGSPAIGTSKAASAGGIAATGPINTEIDAKRRRLVWSGIIAFLAAWQLAFFRFFLPRTLFEPSSVFKIGYPSDFGLGVDTKFQQQFRIWVDRTPDRLFVIYARCTHLGCTPDWKPAENKFKCPCHGSGYDSEGVNFEGPAPRPMDRAQLSLATDGQIIVNVGKLYSWPKGQKSQFDDYDDSTGSGAYLRV